MRDDERERIASAESEASEQQLYSYRTLETPTTIRMLDLFPEGRDRHLRGELTHFDLGGQLLPLYDALSYVWGKPTYDRSLRTTNGDILITPNLEHALKQVRWFTKTRRIWADAICINQRDVEERSRQVKLMGKIYSSARRVIVWLGPDSKNCAKQTFKNIKKMIRGSVGFTSASGVDLSFLIDLFSCDWFERLWVVQEVVLAKAAVVIWGNEAIDFTDLSYAAIQFSKYMPRSRSSWVARIFPAASYHLPGAREDLSFLDVLRGTRYLKCSDPRDKIYAMLSLPYFREDNIIDEIEPDYTRTVADVYHELASMIIRHGGVSEVLNAVHHGSSLVDDSGSLPSWVPWWSDSSATDFYLHTCSMQLPRSIPPALSFSEKTLTVQGVYFNDIIFTSRNDLVHLDCLAEFWSEIVQPLASHHHDLLFCEALMSEQIKLDTNVPNQQASHSSRQAAAYLLANYQIMHPVDEAKCLGSEEEMLRSISSSLAVCSGRSWKEEVKALVPKVEDLHRCETIWRGRRLFFASGNYIGLGPEAIVEGDIIVIPVNATVPCVLRPRKNFYQFIGTANIPGILNGGVTQGIGDNNINFFEIR